MLDLCCGSGASALAAARKVRPTGRVLGVDISENLLTLARGKANREALSWADFELADAEQLDLSTSVSADTGLTCARDFQAWYRISTAADLAVLLTTAGASNVTVHTEHAVHIVGGAEGWWQVIQPLVDADGRLALAVPVHFGVAQVPGR